MPDTILRSLRVVTPSGVHPSAIHVTGGRIDRIADHEDIPSDGTLHDFGNDVIMAGVVDSHVHINEPGRTDWEGFRTATRAAAAGGITMVVDMPLNSIPPTTNVQNLEAKLVAMEGKCSVDVGLWGGAVPGNSIDLRPLLEAGVLGFKCFLIDSGVPEFPHLDERGLQLALETLRDTGAPLLVHAELPGPIESANPGGGLRSYNRFLQSRPAQSEVEAVRLVSEMCEKTGSRAHIVHLSAADALGELRRARERGLPLSAETTAHYLHFAAESIPDGATQYKCAPPIREGSNRERLWEALEEGLIELVVSDHSPCTPELKNLESGDFPSAWGGIASTQFLLPAVWTDAQARGIGLPSLARWLCEGPAHLAGIGDRKGRIAAGLDADFVIWSPESTFVVDAEIIQHRHKVTPYLGEELRGVVRETWLRGAAVFGRSASGPPRGMWVRR
ncbi:MAG: allantoinase AllB [Acidobacteriota bacterium]